MNKLQIYLDFARENGIPLSSINPGSNEIALEYENALLAIEILKDNKVAILGGDILTFETNVLIYAYRLWGDQYQYLNWYCDRNKDEEENEYLARSYSVAIFSINNANEISKRYGNKCYVVIVAS